MKNILLVIAFFLYLLSGKAQSKPPEFITTYKIDSMWIGVGAESTPMHDFPSERRASLYPELGNMILYSGESVLYRDYVIIQCPLLKIHDTIYFKVISHQIYNDLVVMGLSGNKKNKDMTSPDVYMTYIVGRNQYRLVVKDIDFPTKRTMYFITLLKTVRK